MPEHKFTIRITSEMTKEVVERFEDSLAVLLGAMSMQGFIDSDITGNTTVFPRRITGASAGWVAQTLGELMTMFDREQSVVCPSCGSDEIIVSDEDEELFECVGCGYSWETEDASEDD